jgi:hypothetical protein
MIDLQGWGTLLIGIASVYTAWRTTRIENKQRRNAEVAKTAVAIAAATAVAISETADIHAAAATAATAVISDDVKNISAATTTLVDLATKNGKSAS